MEFFVVVVLLILYFRTFNLRKDLDSIKFKLNRILEEKDELPKD